MWILGTMRHRPEIAQRFVLESWQKAVVEDTLRAARSCGLHQPDAITADTVREFFGVPTSETNGHLVYELQLWPEHVYVWSADVAGLIIRSAFKMRGRPKPQVETRQSDAVDHQFRPWTDTEDEVRDGLGEPVSETGWWPEYVHRYTTGGDDLDFTFDHGLLTEVTHVKRRGS
jgi:hypothetical protein